jgi:hypothetical protein
MPVARAFETDMATTTAPAPTDTGYLRLSSCPRCAGRRRALVEVGGRLVGRCLGCGEELSLPLETEWQARGQMVIVGRAGQGILTIDRSGD